MHLDRPIHAILATIVTSLNPTTIPCICIEIELNFSHHVNGWVRMAVERKRHSAGLNRVQLIMVTKVSGKSAMVLVSHELGVGAGGDRWQRFGT